MYNIFTKFKRTNIMITILTLELILKSFLLTWLILNFEPIQTYIVGSLEGLNQGLFTKRPIIYFILGTIIKVPTCSKCCGFWTGLILSSNIYIAVATSILSLLYDRFQGNIKIKLW